MHIEFLSLGKQPLLSCQKEENKSKMHDSERAGEDCKWVELGKFFASLLFRGSVCSEEQDDITMNWKRSGRKIYYSGIAATKTNHIKSQARFETSTS
jgi:hypothetical protein